MRYFLDTNILVFMALNDKDSISVCTRRILVDYSNILYAIGIKFINDNKK